MSGTLAWPPKREDLERLYSGEKLSAAKIAEAYGLKYRSPKVAESTILYHLKKNGIQRRDRAEHIRKVTEEMVDGWVARYQAGESLKQIAEEAVGSVTVWNHLKARGLVLRDKIDAQIQAVTKYDRKSFSGDRIERAYLMGLRYGDLDAAKHGRAVRVRVSTTHPAMADLFESLFSPYGHIHRYPRRARLVRYEWTLECDLDGSFEFLLDKASIAELEAFTQPEFVGFLAGAFDAEGSFLLHKKTSWYDPEASISNGDANFINLLKVRLGKTGFHCSTTWRKQQSERGGISGESLVGRIEIHRFLDAQRFALLIPIRHAEKTRRRELLLALRFGSPAEERIQTALKWKQLSREIDRQVRLFVDSAREQLDSKGRTPVRHAGNSERKLK